MNRTISDKLTNILVPICFYLIVTDVIMATLRVWFG